MVSRLTLEFLLLVISAHKLHVVLLVNTDGVENQTKTETDCDKLLIIITDYILVFYHLLLVQIYLVAFLVLSNDWDPVIIRLLRKLDIIYENTKYLYKLSRR